MLITENGADKSAAPSATRLRNTVTLWIYRETGQDVRSSKSEVPYHSFPRAMIEGGRGTLATTSTRPCESTKTWQV